MAPGLSGAGWVALARKSIIEVLQQEHAAPWIEIEARLADDEWQDRGRTFDPHILTKARAQLRREGLIAEEERPTRGGNEIGVLTLRPTPPRQKRAVEDAAAKKRLLTTRWRGWGRPGDRRPNLIGTGGERVVHRSLQAAAPHGYRMIQPERGEVTALFGEPIPGGPLDNGAWLTPLDGRTQVPTGTTYLVPIEVKNLRHWLYPMADEPFQLLHKAAELASRHPGHPVVPLLVCRRAHHSLRLMAKDLGFLVFETYDQYVRPSEDVDSELFEQVRTGLHLTTMNMTDEPNAGLTTWLTGTVQREAPAYAERWSSFAARQSRAFADLRRETVSLRDRVVMLAALRTQMSREVGTLARSRVSWASNFDEED